MKPRNAGNVFRRGEKKLRYWNKQQSPSFNISVKSIRGDSRRFVIRICERSLVQFRSQVAHAVHVSGLLLWMLGLDLHELQSS